MKQISIEEVSVAAVLEELMSRNQINNDDLAKRFDVNPQTIRNIKDGRAVNAKTIANMIKVFDLRKDARLLQRLLLGYLMIQFQGDLGPELLKDAELISTEQTAEGISKTDISE